jgi:hypothetical protein
MAKAHIAFGKVLGKEDELDIFISMVISQNWEY